MRKIPAWYLCYVHKQGVIYVYMSRSKNTVVACYTLECQLVKTYQFARFSVSSINNAIRLGWRVKGYYWKRI